jgi:hypothetical protein
VPPYYDVSVSALDPGADMVIDDLPTGSVLAFAANAFLSFFFQFVGFLMTYIMHTSHAAKFGSRAGLGLTLIQYGLYSRQAAQDVLDESDAARFADGAWAPQGGSWTNPNGTWTGEPGARAAQPRGGRPHRRDARVGRVRDGRARLGAPRLRAPRLLAREALGAQRPRRRRALP